MLGMIAHYRYTDKLIDNTLRPEGIVSSSRATGAEANPAAVSTITVEVNRGWNSRMLPKQPLTTVKVGRGWNLHTTPNMYSHNLQ